MILPDPTPDGTAAVSELFEEFVTAAFAKLLKRGRLFPGDGSKFSPLIVTGVPGMPILGKNPEIIGDSDGSAILKFFALVAVPKGELTLIGPVVAPMGIVAVI